MMIEQPKLLPDDQLPVTDEVKAKPKVNCLQDILLELMDERKVTLAQIQKETNIPWGTLMGWHNGDVNSQQADRNLLALSKFFNVSLHYLLFGMGDSDPYFKNDETKNEPQATI